MKTLKQLLKQKEKRLHEGNVNLLTEDAIQVVKEWLTEKLKDNECCGECDIINRFIKTELLEELKWQR